MIFTFIGAALLMIVAALAFVVPPFLRARDNKSADTQRAENIAAAKERLKEVQARKDAGEIDAAAAEEYEREIRHQLVAEAGDEKTAADSPPPRADWQGALAAAIFILTIAPAFYLLAGSPQLITQQEQQQHPHAAEIAEILITASERARARGDDERAAELRNRAREILTTSGERQRQIIRAILAQVQQSQTRETQPPPPTMSQNDNANEDNGEGVKAVVILSEELSAQDSHRVFIFARAEQGPRMPLAIFDFTVAQLPVTVLLNDSAAMTPAAKMSAFESYIIVARVSKTGEARQQSGDFFGETRAEPGDSVTVRIDKIAP